MSNDKQTYPTEIVKLPSKGLLYSKENGLSNGEIEIRYPTAKEEDILTSRNLIKQGVAMDMFLKSLIESKNVNYEDLYVGDRDALLMASRILAYSSQYTFEYTCPYCGEKSKVSKDLNDFDDKEID